MACDLRQNLRYSIVEDELSVLLFFVVFSISRLCFFYHSFIHDKQCSLDYRSIIGSQPVPDCLLLFVVSPSYGLSVSRRARYYRDAFGIPTIERQTGATVSQLPRQNVILSYYVHVHHLVELFSFNNATFWLFILRSAKHLYTEQNINSGHCHSCQQRIFISILLVDKHTDVAPIKYPSYFSCFVMMNAFLSSCCFFSSLFCDGKNMQTIQLTHTLASTSIAIFATRKDFFRTLTQHPHRKNATEPMFSSRLLIAVHLPLRNAGQNPSLAINVPCKFVHSLTVRFYVYYLLRP